MVMTAAATDNLTRAVEPAKQRATSPDGTDGVGGVDQGMPFDAVLGVAKGSLEVRARQTGSGSTAAAQMFEASEADAHERRQAALRAEDRDLARTTEDGRLDRTSVQSRSERTPGFDRGGPQPAGWDALAKQGPESFAKGDLASRSQSARQSQPVERPASSSSTGPLVRADRAMSRDVPNSETAFGRRVSVDDMPRPGASVTAATRLAGVSQLSASGTPESVAARVGQVLGASRVGGAEQVRAPQGAAPATDTRPQSQSPRHPAATTRSARAPGGPHAPLMESTDKTTKPFDALVRSIRLQTGSRRSSARMHLNPPELGRVLIDVRMEAERLHVDVRTETAEAARLMHDRAAQLRTALAQSGIIVERFEVDAQPSDVGSDASDANGSFGASSDHHAEPRAEQAPASRHVDTGESMDSEQTESAEDEFSVVAERRLDVRI